jgi:hypothetical protein
VTHLHKAVRLGKAVRGVRVQQPDAMLASRCDRYDWWGFRGKAPGQTRYFLAPPKAADKTLSRVIGVTRRGGR